jgi:hypothetical protein
MSFFGTGGGGIRGGTITGGVGIGSGGGVGNTGVIGGITGGITTTTGAGVGTGGGSCTTLIGGAITTGATLTICGVERCLPTFRSAIKNAHTSPNTITHNIYNTHNVSQVVIGPILCTRKSADHVAPVKA